MKLTRSSADIRRVRYSDTGANASLTLPKEVTEILRLADIEFVRVTTTTEGILLTPYREPELPEWAKER